MVDYCVAMPYLDEDKSRLLPLRYGVCKSISKLAVVFHFQLQTQFGKHPLGVEGKFARHDP